MEDPTHAFHYFAFHVPADVAVEQPGSGIIQRLIGVLHIDAEHISKGIGPDGQVTVFGKWLAWVDLGRSA
ncbi:hypothetical protein D3C75_1068160 [compost metagenome]